MSTERVGVIGSGVMGSGIAQVLAIAGHAVRSYDIDTAALERARATIETGRFGIASAVGRGKLTQSDADAALARLTFTTQLDEALDVDVVIEAIPERLGMKLAFWHDADRRAPEDAIF